MPFMQPAVAPAAEPQSADPVLGSFERGKVVLGAIRL